MNKNNFTENLKLKLISVMVAIIAWIYVILLVKPEITIHIPNVPVIYTNTVNLTQQGYMLTNEDNNVITLKVKGTRNTLAKLDKNEITAVVDLSDYAQEGNYDLPININIPYESISVVDKKPATVNVSIDKKISQKLPVTVYTTGTPKNGFVAYKPVSSINEVKVTGPKNIVSTISEVAVTVNCEGADSDISENCTPVFYNSSGTEIKSELVSTEPETIVADCSVLKKKTVPITLDVDYNSDKIKHSVKLLNKNTIEILGYEKDLEEIVEISTETIYTAGIAADAEISAKLNIPDGIVTADSANEVTVKITVITSE